MADPVRNYIRRSRPELASYRTKKSFWEKLADGNESSGPSRKTVHLPTFGDIRRKFDETNQRRSRSSSTKSNESEKKQNGPKNELGSKKDEPSMAASKNGSPSNDELSHRSPRRRSLEKPKTKTFLHMTEVMEGYVPSDTDSVASNKEVRLAQNGKAEPPENTKIPLKIPASVFKVSDGPTKPETTSVESSNAKATSPISNDGSFRRRNRVRRRGSGKESRFEAVKKEDIESACLGPSPGAKQEETLTSVTSSPQSQVEISGKSVNSSVQDEKTSANVTLQRQDSGDNPLKRKRDRKMHKLKLTTSATNDDTGASPDTPTYEGKSVLSGIKLSTPQTLSITDRQESKNTEVKSDSRRVSDQVDTQSSIANPLVSGEISMTSRQPGSPKKQYESLFLGRKRNFIYPVDDMEDRSSDGAVAKDIFSRRVDASFETKLTTKDLQKLSADHDHSYAADGVKAFDPIDSSSDTARVFDTIDSNCSEHRWSTIDSGISVACALQQNSSTNQASQVTVQPALMRDESMRGSRQRRQRIPSSSSDSDDDSGISWDELKDFRDVPLVVVDKAPDNKVEVDHLPNRELPENVKVELDSSFDKETASLTADFVSEKSNNPSAIGNRINQKWKIAKDDGSDFELEREQPLRTSTPTQVSVVLEPTISASETTCRDVPMTTDSLKTELKPSNALSDPLPKQRGRPDDYTRPSRLSRFLVGKSSNVSASESKDEASETFHKQTDEIKNSENQKSTNAEIYTSARADISTKTAGLFSNKPDISSSKERVRSKSENSEPTFFQRSSRLLTRQLSPMDDVLTKRSPFRMPSSLSSQADSTALGIKRRAPSVSQYQRTHTHSRTKYNTQPTNLFRAKSTPILYEAPMRTAQDNDQDEQKVIRPVIRARESSLSRKKTNPPPIYTPAPPQPTSLASRLLPQRRRSLHRSMDIENDSSFYTQYTDDEDGHSDAERKKDSIDDDTAKTFISGDISGQESSNIRLSLRPSSGVFSESDNEEQTVTKKSIAPSLRLRQKVRSRTSSVSSRPADVSFSDSEYGADGTVVVRKRRRSRSRTRSSEETPESNVNVQVTSTEAGDRKIDTLDSHRQSQARRQMSLSKNHKASSKQVDRESDLDNSFNDDQRQGNVKELKHIKDRNNNMISKQNKSLLSLEQLAEEEIISNASKLQIDLYKHKKHFEKDLSKKLENAMEESDNLVGAIRKSMNESRAKDKVREAMKNVSEVIKFDIIRDYRAKLQWYKVEINLGSYTQNVDARKTSNFRVTVSCEMPDGPKLSKDIHLDFPESVDLSQLEILQVGDDLELRVPFKTWNPPVTMDDVIETDGGDPKDTFTRIGFLEKAYHSMGLQWPPEGATAHYEYFSTRGGDDNLDFNKRPDKPPEYQSLIDSGQLKACTV